MVPWIIFQVWGKRDREPTGFPPLPSPLSPLPSMLYGELRPMGGGDNIPLGKPELTIGRSESCDVTLRFSNVSGKHCKLVLSSGYWYVLDLGSTNGVRVNGVKVTDRRLDPGSRLTIAKHDFLVHFNPEKNGASGPPPAEVFGSQDVFAKSLLEKAGLKRAGVSPTEELPRLSHPSSGIGRPEPDEQPVAAPPSSPVAPREPVRNYFKELVFD